MSLITGSGNCTLLLTSPTNHAIFQRSGTTGPVVFSGKFQGTAPTVIQATATKISGAPGTNVGWTDCSVTINTVLSTFTASLTLAQGWYTVQVRPKNNQANVQTITPVGVGEIFLVGGQSNSCSSGLASGVPTPNVCSNTMSSMRDSAGIWTALQDPMVWCQDIGGSNWPPFADGIVSALNVPVGIQAWGYGGTACQWWTPTYTPGNGATGQTLVNGSGPNLYQRLKTAVQMYPVNGFRAVLWQQGEADASTTTGNYETYLTAIVQQSQADAGWTIPWGICLCSVGQTGAAHSNVTDAQTWVGGNVTGCWVGPNADSLLGSNRNPGQADLSTSGHAACGALWVTNVITQFGW